MSPEQWSDSQKEAMRREEINIVTADRDRLRAENERLLKMLRHPKPDGCPTYYDGCNCEAAINDWMEENERLKADAVEEEQKDFEARKYYEIEIQRLRKALEECADQLEAVRDGTDFECECWEVANRARAALDGGKEGK